MDVAAASMSNSLSMLQSSLSMLVLDKAMGRDAQAMATLISDMSAGVPQLAPKAGSMDIRV